MRAILRTFGFAALGILAAAVSAKSAEVKFFAGGGFKPAANAVTADFERATGHKIVPTFDSTGGLKRRIDAGEKFDVLLIGPGLVDPLIKSGKIVPNSRADIARAGLGVAVKAGAKKPDVSSVNTFKQALLGAASIGYIGDGHSGEFFRAMMTRLGIGEQMKSKLKAMGTAQITKAAASGEVELAVWVLPGLKADKALDVAGPVPTELQDYVDLTAGVSAQSENPDAARALVAHLRSEAARAKINATGWEPAR